MARHEDLRTNAFDLGYLSQTLWSTAHGEPFRLTVLEGATFQPEGLDPRRLRQPHSYLAFHVEPFLLLFAPLYRLWPDPRALLWLQTLVVALGALPIAWMAARLLASPRAGLAFGVAWLLAPGLQGAVLSDFHMVALAAPLLAVGLCLTELGRLRMAIVPLIAAALCREDAALLTAWLGIVLALRGQRHLGTGLALTAGIWAAACFGLIAPYFNGGGSLFWTRYQWLGISPARAVLALASDPTILVRWLLQPDVASYVVLQALTGGIACLLAPSALLAAAPILAINALSSFEWMRSGGAHYSATLVPVLLWAGAHGAQRVPRRAVPGVVLLGTLAAHLWAGVLPLRPVPDARAASVRAALSAIPADVPVSATSAIYPHLADRRSLYWFPAVVDADLIAIDALGTSHPLTGPELHYVTQELLVGAEWGIESATDGLLLLRRGATERDLPPSFFDFPALPGGAARLRFGDSVELLDWRVKRWPQPGLFGDALVLETHWRATAPIADDLRFALATARRSDGALVGFELDAAPGAIWLPPSRWPPGRPIRLEMRVDRAGGLAALGVAVVDSFGRRLPVEGEAPTWEDGTIARLAGL